MEITCLGEEDASLGRDEDGQQPTAAELLTSFKEKANMQFPRQSCRQSGFILYLRTYLPEQLGDMGCDGQQ